LVTSNISAQPETKSQRKNELQIIGSNIWVRSEPTVGEVVMKLSNGDKCQVIDQKRFEYIRGVPHNWYQIVFESDTGWVFGSQTDRSAEIKVLTASSPENLWEIFKTGQIEKCNADDNDDELTCIVDGFNLIMSKDKLKADQLMIHYEREGPSSYLNQINEKFGEHFYIIDELVAQEGAAGISHSEDFYIAFKNSQGYKLPHKAFNGIPTDLNTKNVNEFFLVTFKEFRNVIMYYKSYHNIYLINTKTESIQLMVEEIGKADGGGMMDYEEEGFIYVHKSNIVFNTSSLDFKLLSFSKQRTLDGWLEIDNPQVENYIWDEKKRRFILN